MSEDYAYEPIPGIPGPLPEGERLLWQGSPTAKSLAFKLLYAGWIGAYFAALIAWRLATAIYDNADLGTALGSASWLFAVGALAVTVVFVLATLIARNTIYSITSRRVVMRYGVALPLTINLPFKAIASATVKHNHDGTGNIALEMTGDGRIAYLHLWPNARPWYLAQPQPLLRNIADYQVAAEILRREFLAANPSLISTPASVGAPEQNETAAAGRDGRTLLGTAVA